MDKQELIASISAGESVKYLFFWGHRAPSDGSVSKSCLSQWWPAEFTVEGITYKSAEHWMMAEKARLFGDVETLSKILTAHTPAEAKSLGRKVAPYDESSWLAARYEIVLTGSKHKFGQNPGLKQWLLQTGSRVLVEASPVDPIWGIGLDEHHPDAARPERWPGLNLLGFALMDARELLAVGD